MPNNFVLLLALVLKCGIAGLVLFAAARDIMTRTIPNWIPMTLLLLSTALSAMTFHIIWGLGFGLAIFLICFFCWTQGWMGGGDVKLLGAVAIAVTPGQVEPFLLGVTLFGAGLALAYVIGGYALQRPGATRVDAGDREGLLARVMRVEAWRIRHRGPLPYACAIAAGTLFVLS